MTKVKTDSIYRANEGREIHLAYEIHVSKSGKFYAVLGEEQLALLEENKVSLEWEIMGTGKRQKKGFCTSYEMHKVVEVLKAAAEDYISVLVESQELVITYDFIMQGAYATDEQGNVYRNAADKGEWVKDGKGFINKTSQHLIGLRVRPYNKITYRFRDGTKETSYKTLCTPSPETKGKPNLVFLAEVVGMAKGTNEVAYSEEVAGAFKQMLLSIWKNAELIKGLNDPGGLLAAVGQNLLPMVGEIDK